MSKEVIVTTQKTRKRYKLARLLGVVGILVGACMQWADKGRAPDDDTGLIIFVVGILLVVYAKIGKWWHND